MTFANRKSNWIDTFRGFAMALIFVGHIWNFPSKPKQDLYTYHVAIFFVLAGFLYNAGKYAKISFFKQLKSKARAYLIPYFVLCAANLVLSIVLFIVGNGVTDLGSKLLNWLGSILFVYSPGMPNCATLWFLPCFFVSYVLFALMYRIGNDWLKVAYLIFLFALGSILMTFVPIQLPWYIQVAPFGALFMVAGWLIGLLFKKLDVKLDVFTKKGWAYCLVAVGAFGLNFVMNKISYHLTALNGVCVSLNELEIGTPWIYVAGALFGSVGMLIFFKYANVEFKLMSLWGRHTLLGMGFNLLFMEIASKITEEPWYATFAILLVEYTVVCVLAELAAAKLKGKPAEKEA